jgi:hypothetical protein
VIGPERGEELRSAVAQQGLPHRDLWISYVGLGGDLTLAELESFLDGLTALRAGDYDRLAVVANEELRDRGAPSPVPYSEDVGGPGSG